MLELKGDYFDGQFFAVPADGPEAPLQRLERENPSNTQQKLWSMGVSFEHLAPIVESANRGFARWKNTPMAERVALLRKFQKVVTAKKEEVARAISLEVGKPYWEALTEAQALASKVDVTIEKSLPRLGPKVFEEILPQTRGHVLHKPVGPCLVIGAFNFPCHLANGQILSALVAGNSVIFKPSGKALYSGQLLVECFHEAEFPPGAINLVAGGGEMARRLLREKSIKGVFFTGSKEVGLQVLRETHQDLGKLVSLELGGKNPAIVCEDCFFDEAVDELIRGCFLTTGQRCTSTSLIFVHENILGAFQEKFHALAKGLVVDHPLEHDRPFMGPLIDRKALESYLLYMGIARREGIEEIMRGKVLERKHPGHYVSPSLHLAKEFRPSSHFLSSEIFAPNATLIPFTDYEQALQGANATEYGLAAAVFSSDPGKYRKALEEIDAGIINFNRSTIGASPELPFGGVKNSGNYRPGALVAVDHCTYQVAGLEALGDGPRKRRTTGQTT